MAAMASSWHRCVWLIVGLRSIERQRPWWIRLGPKDFLDTPYRFWWQVVFPKGLVFFSPLRSYPCDQYIYIFIYTPAIILLPHVNMSFQLSFCDTYTLNDINSNGALYPHETHIIFHVTRPLREAVFRWFFTSKLGNPTTVRELSETKVLGDQKRRNECWPLQIRKPFMKSETTISRDPDHDQVSFSSPRQLKYW